MQQSHQSVLVVDDSATNLQVVASLLEAYAYEILTARDGAAGIVRARLTRPDLILLDVEMPVLDGFETCRRLKADPDLMDIPVIFMTVRSESADKVAAFRAGAVDYVTKPLEPQELVLRVRAQLQLRRLQEAAEQRSEDLEVRVAERTAELQRTLDQRNVDLQDRQRLSDEREHLVGVVRSQSEQVRRLTAEWVSAQHRVDQGLHRSLSERMTERFALVDAHLTEVKHLIAAGECTEYSTEANRHLDVAITLLKPALSPVPGDALAADSSSGVDVFERLSDRERQVLTLLTQGRSAKEIAAVLGVARTTVSTYRGRLMEKLGVEDLTALVKLTLRYERDV